MLFRQYDLNQTSKVEVNFGSNTECQYWSGSDFAFVSGRDVPYKTLLLSISDSVAFIVEEMLEKYGRSRR